jgi:hypothetical protein
LRRRSAKPPPSRSIDALAGSGFATTVGKAAAVAVD